MAKVYDLDSWSSTVTDLIVKQKNWNGKERQQKRPEIIREDFNQATRRYLSKI